MADDESAALRKRCESELQDLFLNASVLPGQSDDDPELRVIVEAFDDPENPGYVTKLGLYDHGELVPDTAREVTCELCTHGEVAAKLRVEVDVLITLWRERKATAPEPLAPTGPTGSTGAEGPVAPTGSDPATNQGPKVKKPLGPLGYAGIAGLGVGVVGVGVGAAFVGRADEPVGPTFVDTKNYRRPGAVALGVGVGALVTGAVLLTVDRIRAKRAAKAETKPSR